MNKLYLIVGYDTNISNKLFYVKFDILDWGLESHSVIDFAEEFPDFPRLTPSWSSSFSYISHLSFCSIFQLLHIVKLLLEFLITLKKIDQNLVIVIIVNDPIRMLGVKNSPFFLILFLLPFFIIFVQFIIFVNYLFDFLLNFIRVI